MAARTPKIPKVNSLLNSSMDGMDELFQFKTKEPSADAGEEMPSGGIVLMEMEFSVLEFFPDHKFRLYTGQRLNDMVESIKEYGILQPIIVWHREDKYILLSGHNRVNAGKLAGLTKCAAIVKENLSYEDAVLIVTETNLRQRSFEDMSLSERAVCLKQHYEAIKSQGRRTDLLNEIENLVNPHEIGENRTSSEIQTKLRSDEKMGSEYGLSRDNVAKYLRIATLSEPLLELLDEKQISMAAAYDVSFVEEVEKQGIISELLQGGENKLDMKKAALIHDYAKNGTLTEERIRQIITGEKTKKPKGSGPRPIQIKAAVITRFFAGGQNPKEIEETIVKALEMYFAETGEGTEPKVG